MEKIRLDKRFVERGGMTFPELLVATLIFILAVTGLMLSYLRAMELQEVAQATSIATKAAMSRMDTIRSATYAQIKATYNGVVFDIPGLKAKGVSYVNDANPNLLLVTIDVSWKQKNGRVYGEDKNINGTIEAGEDVSPNNNMLDGPVQLASYIFKP